MKAIIIWVVLATPTPKCLEDYDARTIVELTLQDGTTTQVRWSPNGEKRPEPVREFIFRDEEPTFADPAGCYDARVGRLEVPEFVKPAPKAEKKAVKGRAKAGK